MQLINVEGMIELSNDSSTLCVLADSDEGHQRMPKPLSEGYSYVFKVSPHRLNFNKKEKKCFTEEIVVTNLIK